MEDYRWKEGRIGWEIHVGDYGWRMIVGSGGKKGGEMGLRMFDRHEEDEREKERIGGSEEDDKGRLTLKLHLLHFNWFSSSVNFPN